MPAQSRIRHDHTGRANAGRNCVEHILHRKHCAACAVRTWPRGRLGRPRTAATRHGDGKRCVDVQTQSTLGPVVRRADADRVRGRSLQQPAERTKRSNGAGRLHGDFQRNGERFHHNHAADSLHGAVEPRASEQTESAAVKKGAKTRIATIDSLLPIDQ